jgi:hypothetical protein
VVFGFAEQTMIRLRTCAALGVVILALVGAPRFAMADQDGPLSTAQPDRPLPPPSPEIRAARAKRALAQKVYDLIGAQTLSPSTRALAASLSVQVARAVTNKDIARAKAIMAAVNDGLDDIMPSLSEATVTLMAADFSTEQLQALLDFYQTPAGQAALKILPRIASQASTLSLKMTPEMMVTIRDSYCGRVRCTAQEQSAFTAIAQHAAAAAQPTTLTPTAAPAP